MIVYRLTKVKYAGSLSGVGASLSGGRWNKKGTQVIYTSETRALSALETLAHFDTSSPPEDFIMMSVEIPDTIEVFPVDLSRIPKGWDNVPYSDESVEYGDQLLKTEDYCVFKFPSAVIPKESNFLINPNNKNFRKVSIRDVESFELDQRILRLIK